MSTIYRYLDVLSVEKCIVNINDFIKTKVSQVKIHKRDLT